MLHPMSYRGLTPAYKCLCLPIDGMFKIEWGVFFPFPVADDRVWPIEYKTRLMGRKAKNLLEITRATTHLVPSPCSGQLSDGFSINGSVDWDLTEDKLCNYPAVVHTLRIAMLCHLVYILSRNIIWSKAAFMISGLRIEGETVSDYPTAKNQSYNLPGF
jgi:hypothetical protein